MVGVGEVVVTSGGEAKTRDDGRRGWLDGARRAVTQAIAAAAAARQRQRAEAEARRLEARHKAARGGKQAIQKQASKQAMSGCQTGERAPVANKQDQI